MKRALLAKRILVAGVGSLLSLLLVEGVASVGLALLASPDGRIVAERRHTEFDPDLGWIHRPNCRVPNLYGKGKGLTTNAQRIRASSDLPATLAPGRHRIVCAGDSFTLGYGVGDADTWAAQLAAQLPDTETVNMGQGGYGADQAWLWYRRDATFEHDTLLFAPIAEDFTRMAERTKFGLPKPWVTLRDGRPVVANTPLSPPNPKTPWIEHARFSLRATATTRVIEALAGGLRTKSIARSQPSDALVGAMLDDLLATCGQRRARLVIVLLPTPYSDEDGMGEHWRQVLAEWTRTRGVLFIDLVTTLRALSREATAALFIDAESLLNKAYLGAVGHFNEAGNAWVAQEIAAALAR